MVQLASGIGLYLFMYVFSLVYVFLNHHVGRLKMKWKSDGN